MAKNYDERNGKEKKKKKSKAPLLFIVLLLLIAALLLLMNYLGLGFGGGKGDGGSSNGNESVAATADDSNTATEKTNVVVTVKGSSYVYDGAELTLDELKTKLSELDKDKTVVELKDDGAVENAMSDAKTAVEGAGLSVVTPADSSSSTE
ncbi:MAG: hypothetical protein J6O40_07820 [Ruminococcus sp.]|nr:hypothetical protein [Ruminococcus sp.]